MGYKGSWLGCKVGAISKETMSKAWGSEEEGKEEGAEARMEPRGMASSHQSVQLLAAP